MTTASPLKAASSALPPEFFGAEGDSDYAEKYQNAQNAEQKLMAMLEQRNESRLSPSMLALAGELLDPGRTGSFGEALGRGAKSYATMQGAEDKQLADNAMMQMQLRNMQLERAQQGQMAKMAAPFVNGLLNNQTESPVQLTQPAAAAPVASRQGQSTITNPEAAAPEAETAIAPVPLATPTAATAPAADQNLPSLQEPTVMINNRPVNAKTIAGLKMVPATKAMGDALEFAYKDKLDQMDREYKERQYKLESDKFALSKEEAARSAIKVQPDYYVDTTDPKNPIVKPIIRQGEPDVSINFPEFGGVKMDGSKEDLVMLRAARAAKDAPKVKEIYDRLRYGVREPTATTSEAPSAAMDIEANKAAQAKREAVSKTTGETQAKETQTFLQNDSTNRETVFTASRILQNAEKNPQLYGILKKPGIGTALASFIKDRGDAGQYAITKENLEDFLRKANLKTTDEDLGEVAKMSSDLARLHFNYRKMLLQGQGSVSDKEDQGISKIQGTTSDPALFLINMAQLTGRRAQFDSDVAGAFRKYNKTNGNNNTLEDYRSDPTSNYNKLLSGYENWLTRTYKLPGGLTPQTSTSVAPVSDSSLEAEIERRKKEKGK
jgi:hypothetical protein